jgi:virginiamycin A acetyltransferase
VYRLKLLDTPNIKSIFRNQLNANRKLKSQIRKISRYFLKVFYPQLYYLENNNPDIGLLAKNITDSHISAKAKISGPAQISDSEVGDYSYIARGSSISLTKIGKFCSIGTNLSCGYGIHPTNGLSTSPVFYSLAKQNGTTFSKTNKITENLPITIGNDVFIGMNVTILDGVTISDGAIIGAGAVVSKDIPPYAIAVGSPIRVIKYRFDEQTISDLLKIKWWDFDTEKLQDVEKDFFNTPEFIRKFKREV